jgi:hypothetical protein
MIWRVAFAAWLTICLAVLGTQQPRAQFNGCQAGFCAPAAVSSGFSGPASFGANLLQWVKADAGVFSNTACTTATLNTGNIVCWQDQSGNRYDYGASDDCDGIGAARPTLNTAGLNGKPAAVLVAATPTYFVNKAGCLTGQNAFNWGGASPTFSVWAAVSFTASQPVDACLSSFHGTTAGNDFGNVDSIVFNCSPSPNTDEGPWWDGNDGRTDHTGLSSGTAFAYSVVFDGTTLTSYIGNASGVAHTWAVALTAAGQSGPVILVGNRVSSRGATNNWDGAVAEWVIINKAASSTDRSNMQTYLCTTRGYGC